MRHPDPDWQRLDNLVERVATTFQVENTPEAVAVNLLPVDEWAENRFYLIEKSRPIQLMWHQREILNLFSEQKEDGRFNWTTCMYSTIKKSGKTTVSALYGRWAAECWGPYQEVYNLGNKLNQAKSRAFKTAKRSIELAPQFVRDDWDVQATLLTHLPSGSVIEPLPISGAGEAGANQSLTIWTELWGFQYEDALLMWDEMKPVATRILSQRFIDTYAGFDGVSLLLWDLWQAAKEYGEQLHPDLPIFGNAEWGLIAYIDQGVAARRMPWQLGAVGEKYYAEQEATELDATYQRHHLNEWTQPQAQFIEMVLWDSLKEVPTYPMPQYVPVVMAIDASVSSDATALSVVTYRPKDDMPIELESYRWIPPADGKIDYDDGLIPVMREMVKKWNVIKIGYDEFQLHQTMIRLQKDSEDVFSGIPFEAFSQQKDRELADTALQKRIKSLKFRHSGNTILRQHVQSADAKIVNEQKIRIVKRDDNSSKKKSENRRIKKTHIDMLVCVSMASWMAVEILGDYVDSPARNMQIRVNRRYG